MEIFREREGRKGGRERERKGRRKEVSLAFHCRKYLKSLRPNELRVHIFSQQRKSGVKEFGKSVV